MLKKKLFFSFRISILWLSRTNFSYTFYVTLYTLGFGAPRSQGSLFFPLCLFTFFTHFPWVFFSSSDIHDIKSAPKVYECFETRVVGEESENEIQSRRKSTVKWGRKIIFEQSDLYRTNKRVSNKLKWKTLPVRLWSRPRQAQTLSSQLGTKKKIF